jgi:hypothetical protein
MSVRLVRPSQISAAMGTGSGQAVRGLHASNPLLAITCHGSRTQISTGIGFLPNRASPLDTGHGGALSDSARRRHERGEKAAAEARMAATERLLRGQRPSRPIRLGDAIA